MIGARSSRYIVAFRFTASQLTRSNSQTSNLPSWESSPHTAALQNYELSASRLAVPSGLGEPTPESNDLAMSRLRIQERIINSFVGVALNSLNLFTRNSQTCISFYFNVM